MIAAGCSKSHAPADPSSVVAPTTGQPTSPTPSVPNTVFIPDDLGHAPGGPWLGVVFTDPAGGEVNAHDAGATVPLKDGTVVRIKSMELPVGPAAPSSSAKIDVDGRLLTISAMRVLDEHRLVRSPNRAFAIFSAHDTCRDHCRDTVYLFSRDGRRLKLIDLVQDVVVAWRPDGKQLSVGSICRPSSTGCDGWTKGALWIVDLPAMKVRTVPGYTAPAYSRDGVLYARNHHGAAFRFERDKPNQVWKPATNITLTAPEPVEFDDAGKPRFELE